MAKRKRRKLKNEKIVNDNVWAVYYRVSTDKQQFASQKESISEYLKKVPDDKKPNEIKYYKDKMSGRNFDRPEFNRMLRDAKARKINTIIVYKLDRLSRHAATAIRCILDLDDYDVAFISVTQAALNLGHDNPFRKTMIAAFSEIGQIEVESIRERVKAGMAAARRKGVTLGRPRTVSDETRAKCLELIAEGLTYRKIAQELNISFPMVSVIKNQSQKG